MMHITTSKVLKQQLLMNLYKIQKLYNIVKSTKKIRNLEKVPVAFHDKKSLLLNLSF